MTELDNYMVNDHDVLLIDWLESKLGISNLRPETLTDSFANGYLFGVILNKMSLNPDLARFSEKTTRKDILNNYSLLYRILEARNVKFNINMAQTIINKTPGAAQKLLYQLYIMHDVILSTPGLEMAPKEQTTKIASKNPTSKTVVEGQLFDNNLSKRIISDKNKNMFEKVSKKYENFKDMTQDSQVNQRLIDEETKAYKYAMLRKENLEKMRVNSDFMKDWWAHGLEEHAKNLKIRRENELHDLKFKVQREQNKRSLYQLRMEESVQDVNVNIEQFEKDLVLRQFKPEEASRNVSQQSVYERSSRLRKVLNDEINLMQRVEDTRREEEYIDFLNQRSRDEEQQARDEWYILQCKNILIEGRKLTAARYQSRRELDIKAADLKESELLEDEKKVVEAKVLHNNQKLGQLKDQESDLESVYNYRVIKEMLGKIVDLNCAIGEFEEVRHQPIDDIQKARFLNDFVTNRPYSIEEKSSTFQKYEVKLFEKQEEIVINEEENTDKAKKDDKSKAKDKKGEQQATITYVKCTYADEFMTPFKGEFENANQVDLTLYLEQAFEDSPKDEETPEEKHEDDKAETIETLISSMLTKYFNSTENIDNQTNFLYKVFVYGCPYSGKKSIANYIIECFENFTLLDVNYFTDLLLKLLMNENMDNEDQVYSELVSTYYSQHKDDSLLTHLHMNILKGHPMANQDIIQLLDSYLNFLYATMQNQDRTGVVIINFPMYATFLEELEATYKIIGLPPIKDENEAIAYHTVRQYFKIPEVRQSAPKTNPLSLGMVFELYMSADDCFRRVLADRYDGQSDTKYHLFDKVPPTDQLQLIEKLTVDDNVKFIAGNVTCDYYNYERNREESLKFLNDYKYDLSDVASEELIKTLNVTYDKVEKSAFEEKKVVEPVSSINVYQVVDAMIPYEKLKTDVCDILRDYIKFIDYKQAILHSLEKQKEIEAKEEADSYENIFEAEYQQQVEAEKELLDNLIELAGEKDKKKIENRLKEVKPVPTLGALSGLTRISTVDKSIYLKEFWKGLQGIFLTFRRDYSQLTQSFKDNLALMNDYLNTLYTDFNTLIHQVDRRIIHSIHFLKNYNVYIRSVPQLVEDPLHFEKLKAEVTKLDEVNKQLIKVKCENNEALFEQFKTSAVLNAYLERAMRAGLEMLQIEVNKTCKLYNFMLNFTQFNNDVHSNLVDNFTVKNDLFVFLECMNFRELENYHQDEENGLVFPKLEALKEAALQMAAKICTAQAKVDDTKKKQGKGAVENEKNMTEQICSPHFQTLTKMYKRKVSHITAFTKAELNKILNTFDNYGERLNELIMQRNSLEETQHSQFLDSILSKASAQEEISGEVLMHDTLVKIQPFNINFNVDTETLECDKVLINEAGEAEQLVKAWLGSTEDNKVSRNLILSDIMIRYIFNKKEDEGERLSEKGAWDAMLVQDPLSFRSYLDGLILPGESDWVQKDKLVTFFLLSGTTKDGYELNKLADLAVKARLVDKKGFVEGNVGFDELIQNDGGAKGRKFMREKKIKEIIAEIVAPADKNFDVLKLYFLLSYKKQHIIDLSTLTKNKYDEDIYELFKTNYVSADMYEKWTTEFPNWEAFRVKLENKTIEREVNDEDEEEEEELENDPEKDFDWWVALQLDYYFSTHWDPSFVLTSIFKPNDNEGNAEVQE